MKNPLFSNFFPREVLTFISDKTADFSIKDFSWPFNADQTTYLSTMLNIDSGSIVNIQQVHGSSIEVISQVTKNVPQADGLITNKVNLPIVIRTADCIPIFLYDPVQRVIGLIHAGWKGSRDQIVVKAVELMTGRFKSEPEFIRAAIGPHICVNHYQVGQEFSAHFSKEIVKREDRYYLDLFLVNKNQLLKRGVKANNIFNCDICTYANAEYHSFRRDGKQAGRILSLMMLKE